MSDSIGINVVFTDLVGSTELSSRLGPEATEALRVEHFALLRGAMEQHNGTEVKNLGDGLMVIFPSLGAALDGSVAMQQAIERHNTSGKEPLGVRVGLSTGDATEEDGDYFGEPVVEAARLCAKCDAGQIITTELVSLLGRKSGHTFDSVGDLELKGLPEPVPSVEIRWEPVQIESAVALPDRMVPDMEFAIAGRAAETEQLTQAYKASTGGERRVTFLAGEPGIGKTRLSAELAVLAHDDGAVVLYGRCDEELTVPYQPWVEAITHLLGAAPASVVDHLVQHHGPELTLLVPSLRRDHPDIPMLPSSDPETERYMLMQAVTSALAHMASRSPLLLVLDDLHWAGAPDLTMLRHVLTNIPAASVMIVGTYRDSDLDAGHPLIDTVAALRREAGTERIVVRGLDDLGVLALVEASAGQAFTGAAKDMAISLRQESAGNPFFAHEILRNLVESGTVYLDDDGEWVVPSSRDELEIPESVRDVVGQRIARMGEATEKTLRAAAVIGREFDLGLLARVTGDDEDDLLDMIEAVIEAGILTEVVGGDERFRFPHALARNTLQSGLSDGRRRRLHRKVAEALEELYGAEPGDRVGELATHWLAATASVEASKATHYARLAGQQAEAGLAPDEAVRWFTMALENLEMSDADNALARVELLVDLGTAQKHAGDAAYRETLLEASREATALGETSLMVAAAIANSRGFISKLGQVDDERVAALEAALEAIGTEPSAERALVLATLSGELEYDGELEARQHLIEEALVIARALDDPATLAAVNNRFCMSFAIPQTLDERRAASAESLAIAEQLGDQTIGFWAGCGSVQAALMSGDGAAANAALDRLLAAADEIGRPSFRWIAGCIRGSVLGAEGRTDELEVAAAETLALGEEAGEPDAFEYYAGMLMTVRWIQGRGIEIVDQVRQAAEDLSSVTIFEAALARFLCEGGEIEEAQALLDNRRASAFEAPVNNSWSTFLATWASVAELLDDAPAAGMLYDLLLPWSGQVTFNRVNGVNAVDGALGGLAAVLGEVDTAERHFEAARVTTDALGASYFAAWNDAVRARMHARRPDGSGRPQATEFAERALQAARTGGFATIEAQAAETLADLPPA